MIAERRDEGVPATEPYLEVVVCDLDGTGVTIVDCAASAFR